MKKWFEISALQKNGTADIFIYGDIGESWTGETVTAREFVQAIGEITSSQIDLRINSYGGSVTDGIAIYNALKRHPATVNVFIDGAAYSIASLIAMAGDNISMAENALMMIHAPWAGIVGNAAELRNFADLLDKYAETMVSAYSLRLSEEVARSILTSNQDHWFSAAEAEAAGLVDSIYAATSVAAAFRESRFSIPAAIAASIKEGNTMSKTAAVEDSATQAIQRIGERNESIMNVFSLFLERDGVQELQARVLGDVNISHSEANKMLLAHLAKGVEPVAAGSGGMGFNVVSGDNSHHVEFQKASVDALLLRSGFPVKNAHPAANDLRGMTVLNMAERMVSNRSRGFSSNNPNAIISAALSTSDFPALLANTANKALMLGYTEEPSSHKLWVRETEANDFKPISRVAISAAPSLQKVLENGPYTYGAMNERSESFQLETYGKILSLTRKAMINDDLGAFTRVPKAFGQSAARLEADKVYALLTGNPTMSDGTALFHANHHNLMAGGALSVSTLGIARAAMRKQKGFDGVGILNVLPVYLIVPAALETVAMQLIASLVDPSKNNDTQNVDWIRSLVLVVEPRLDDDSPTAWYLAGSNTQVDTVEVAHLAGQYGVFVENQPDFESDNFMIKARLDFAAQVIDWVGLVKNPGA